MLRTKQRLRFSGFTFEEVVVSARLIGPFTLMVTVFISSYLYSDLRIC